MLVAGPAQRSLSAASTRRAPVVPAQCRLRSLSARSSSKEVVSFTVKGRIEETSLTEATQTTEADSANQWDAIPAHHQLTLASSLAFMCSNMDKVNISIAIIPMAADFGWSPIVSGFIQSAFFWGFLLMQIPGGHLSSKHTGRRVLPFGVATFSLATALLPWAAASLPGLCLSRSLVGVGEAVAPTSIIDIAARAAPPDQRSAAVSLAFCGLHFGSIVGLLASPILIDHFGWESVFWSFGAVGLVWCAGYEIMLSRLAVKQPEFMQRFVPDYVKEATLAAASSTSSTVAPPTSLSVPFRAFLRSRPMQALMFTHFCNSWFHYTMLAWLPTYFIDTLSVDLMHAAQTALFPPLAGIAVSVIAGPAADHLIKAGMPVAHVRKLAQCTGFLGPTACLLAAANTDNLDLTVALITLALGLNSFSLAGLYCSHQDMSPKYASTLLGLTNTAGSLPGIIGVATVGCLLDQTQSWAEALFLPSCLLMALGAGVYVHYGRNERIDFDALDNGPFAIESWWQAKTVDSKARVQQTWQWLTAPLADLLGQKDKML